jgi:hypothetical protein
MRSYRLSTVPASPSGWLKAARTTGSETARKKPVRPFQGTPQLPPKPDTPPQENHKYLSPVVRVAARRPLESPGDVVGIEAGDSGHRLEVQASVDVLPGPPSAVIVWLGVRVVRVLTRFPRSAPHGGDGRFAYAGQAVAGQDFLGPLRQRLLHGQTPEPGAQVG